MTQFASVRLTRQLNAMITNRVDPERAAAGVLGADVAHHILDPDGVGGLDPARSTTLVDALPGIGGLEGRGWLLALPAPGRLSVLRGPAELNRAAVAAGSAVIALTAQVALVPIQVGPAVQWRLYRAEPPAPPPSSSEAERALSHTILTAGRALTRLDVAAGPAPAADVDLGSGAGYSPRQVQAADRAARLLLACATALEHDGASVSSYEMDARRRELLAVQAAAREALVAAVSWREAAELSAHD